ncbi:hypothetical protein [Desulfobulbus alkaliphilus]|uniref:hypothetical protein n=1 Tax=Desulfobulbus alkaliphilus TaxID=869814 RepID=UPI00196631CF|nr:hypothetical protein [Desulfobulbus alkaliphilus]MBM9535622.1 hypothetical protein [Desulfobulbus alkaliphilus]
MASQLQYPRKKRALSFRLGQLLTLLAVLMITVEIGMLLLGGKGLCASEGCLVVDQLTTVSPLLFNLVGLFFFLLLLPGWRYAGSQSDIRAQLFRLLLLGGLAAEGVLIGFQLLVVDTFCLYCLIVFTFILLLNLLAGIRQLLAGLFVFATVLLTMFSLEFSQTVDGSQTVDNGVFASRPSPTATTTAHFFFSSTCPHCKTVLDAMVDDPGLTIHFNPTDSISSLEVAGVTLNPDYSAAANRAFLRSVGIEEIPVLLIHTDTGGYLLIRGEQAILQHLASLRVAQHETVFPAIGTSSFTSDTDPLIPPAAPIDGACSIATDCDEDPLLPWIEPRP